MLNMNIYSSSQFYLLYNQCCFHCFNQRQSWSSFCQLPDSKDKAMILRWALLAPADSPFCETTPVWAWAASNSFYWARLCIIQLSTQQIGATVLFLFSLFTKRGVDKQKRSWWKAKVGCSWVPWIGFRWYHGSMKVLWICVECGLSDFDIFNEAVIQCFEGRSSSKGHSSFPSRKRTV